MTSGSFRGIVDRIRSGEALTAEDSQAVFAEIMTGQACDEDIASVLTALAQRKPTMEEIVGAARALRACMTKIHASDEAIDLCGTGGDGHNTLNISTASAFVVAASGVPVAKHGNRSMSSKCGTADVLEALGGRIELSPAAAEACLRDAGICFLFAQTYHPAMRRVANVRRQLGFRTIFNLLGPLCSPAGVRRQLVGVSDGGVTRTIANALLELGSERGWVVHGCDGLDELTITGKSQVVSFAKAGVEHFQVEPSSVDLPVSSLDDIQGGDASTNAAAIRDLFAGRAGAFRNVVMLNSAAALIVAGQAATLKEGTRIALTSIESGAAARALDRFVATTQKLAA
ncbi:MAG: anthranilate phosphoribosyltransferase [Alphaproteobacteria bacterium]|nr:anthranilate phosphoribosyltransferase [Alphaproteobacteria bacterium]